MSEPTLDFTLVISPDLETLTIRAVTNVDTNSIAFAVAQYGDFNLDVEDGVAEKVIAVGDRDIDEIAGTAWIIKYVDGQASGALISVDAYASIENFPEPEDATWLQRFVDLLLELWEIITT